ncbi:MAG: hypothetical protein KGJ86_06425, partial [Chloroflexota bacterium]|nr:hypothetical protein [Chloroflexota bacterium]
GRPARAREAAVRSLEQLGERQDRINDELVQLLDDRRLASRGTRIAAVGVLRRRKCREALPALRKLIDRDPDGRLVRLAREAVQALESGEDREDELRQLRERVDALSEENRKLRDRLDRLEATQGSSQ